MAIGPLSRVLGVRRRTKSGVYTNKGFKIDSKGIQESPAAFGGARRRQFSLVNDMEDLEIGVVIGHGAGGVVVRPARPPARPPRAQLRRCVAADPAHRACPQNKAIHKPTSTVVAVKVRDVDSRSASLAAANANATPPHSPSTCSTTTRGGR